MDDEAAVPVGVDDNKTEDHDPVRKQDGEQNGKQDVDSSLKRNSRNWVEILKSPTDMPQFSPSLMLDGNLHGLGTFEEADDRTSVLHDRRNAD